MIFLTPHTFVFSVLYGMMLFVIFSVQDFFMFWVVIELSTLVFIGISYSCFKNHFSRLLMFFVIQAVSAFMLLIFFIKQSTFMFTLSFLIKMAMFPYHFWYFSLVPFFPNFVLIFSMTLFKIPSVYILRAFFNLLDLKLLFMSSLITVLVGGSIMIFSNDLRFILIGSSVANNSWFVLSQMTRTFIFLTFFVLYSWFVLVVFSVLDSLISYSSKNTSISARVSMILGLIVLSGIPPFPIFFVKMFIVLFMAANLNYSFFVLILMILNILVLLGYLKYIFNHILSFYGNLNSFILFS